MRGNRFDICRCRAWAARSVPTCCDGPGGAVGLRSVSWKADHQAQAPASRNRLWLCAAALGSPSRVPLSCRDRRRGVGLEATLGGRRRFARRVFVGGKRLRGHETAFDGRNSVRRYGRNSPLRLGNEILTAVVVLAESLLGSMAATRRSRSCQTATRTRSNLCSHVCTWHMASMLDCRLSDYCCPAPQARRRD